MNPSDTSQNWGWACERVQAVDVVTADGDLLHCNASHNQDLYWAARGAGPGECLFRWNKKHANRELTMKNETRISRSCYKVPS